jgi:glycine oxidase
LVLAAGAWTPQIEGVPMALPVEPVRGQMMAFEGTPARHVAFAAGCYLIPKADGRTIAGSTLEHVGFEPEVTEEGIARVRAMAESACPTLGTAPVHATWAGLRPMTPDLLPILGPDPDEPRIVYACGHSRNGILLAPLTAACVADFAMGRAPTYDVAQLRPGRFLR